VVSTDGLIGREAKNLLKQIALRLTAKWEQPYSVVRGFVNARINLAILRATNLCRHAPMSEHSPKSNTTPLIKPSSKSNSTTLPKHKNALPRVTNSKQQQPIDIDPNTILRNSLITTNYYFDLLKKIILHILSHNGYAL
jgi:hypothetical protein